LITIGFVARYVTPVSTSVHLGLNIRASQTARFAAGVRIQCVLPFGVSLTRPSVAQALAAQVIGVRSFALPGSPFGAERDTIGQLPSGICVATRKSIPLLISGRSDV
jgi:hypothetical protein